MNRQSYLTTIDEALLELMKQRALDLLGYVGYIKLRDLFTDDEFEFQSLSVSNSGSQLQLEIHQLLGNILPSQVIFEAESYNWPILLVITSLSDLHWYNETGDSSTSTCYTVNRYLENSPDYVSVFETMEPQFLTFAWDCWRILRIHNGQALTLDSNIATSDIVKMMRLEVVE